jgi:hypothetical protein
MGTTQTYLVPDGGVDGRAQPDPALPPVRLPGGLRLRKIDERGGWFEVADPTGTRYWVAAAALVAAVVQVTRRPAGWYAQLYRRTYGQAAPTTKAGVPAAIWIGLALVVGGIFVPWVRGLGGWIAAFTALDVPLRATWGGAPSTGGGSGIVNALTGLSVGFCAIVLAIAALVSALGILPKWVRTVAALGIVAMPTAVAAQIARDASDAGTKFLSVVGPGIVLMMAGGVLIGLAKPPGGSR